MANDSADVAHDCTAAVPRHATHGQTFPFKLHGCLTELERDGLSHVAGFQPHGRCIMVRNQHEFVTQILPRWFNQTKYASFQRQLNIYGFQRISAGPDKHGYHHPAFLRGRPELVPQISRMGIKGNGRRPPASHLEEPNFYSRPFVTDQSDEPGITFHALVPSVAVAAEPSHAIGAVWHHSLPLPRAAPTGHAVPSRAVPWADSMTVHTLLQRQRDQLVEEQRHGDQVQRHRELQQLMQQPPPHPLQQLVAQQRQRELEQAVQQQQLQQLVEQQRQRELQQAVQQQQIHPLQQLVEQRRQQQLEQLVEQHQQRELQQLVGQQRQHELQQAAQHRQLQELVGQQRHRELQQLSSSSLAPPNLGHTTTQIALQALHASVGNAPLPATEQLSSNPSPAQLLLRASLLGAFPRQDM